MDKKDEKLKNKNFIDALKNALNGCGYAIKTQINIKIQLVIGVLVLALSCVFKLEIIDFIFVIFAIFLVIFAEMVNTAIETVVDLYTSEYHQKAKIAKDVGAGAVLVMSINSVIVAGCIFLKYFIF